jgi:hypothetical protein
MESNTHSEQTAQTAQTSIEKHICNKPGCGNEGKLRCPTCIKLKIKAESFFCGKECFTGYWSEHKKLHEECK